MTLVIQNGFGSVGRRTTKILLGRKNLELVGVADNDVSLLDKDLVYRPRDAYQALSILCNMTSTLLNIFQYNH